MAAVQDDVLDVLVVGSGWSGLIACKYAIEHGLTVKVLEKRNSIGGVWCYTDDKSVPTVMKTTRMSSSSCVTEMSDFPMPTEYGDFPKHQDVYNYLESYCDRFYLKKHVTLNCMVKQVEKVDELWKIVTASKDVYWSKHLAVCTGIHQKPDMSLKDTLLKCFSGDIHHSSNIKDFIKDHSGKRVMIVGGGETASDILEIWYKRCKNIIWCIPRGQHFFRKYSKILPHRSPQALDKASSRAMKAIAPYTKSKPGLAWVCKWTTRGSLLAYQGHGIPEYRNDAAFFHSFINKQAHVLNYIDNKKVIPKGRIASIHEKTVCFEDGSILDVDVVIMCNGYITEFPFLPTCLKHIAISDNYKFVFNATDTSLAFIGFVRPIVGSIPTLSELQAQWVMKVWSKKISIISESDRILAIEKDNLFWSEYFQGTSKRLHSLVEAYTYGDDVAKLSHVYPNYWQLFKRDPRSFFTAYFAPYNGCSYRLNEEKYEKEALKTLQRHRANTINPCHLLLLFFLRMIWFDWFLDKLAFLKYRCQTNWIWKKVRNYRIVKVLDYIWTMPKRYLFDETTKHCNHTPS